MMTPAMMIKMAGTDAIDRHDDEEAGNIYEEIIPPDKRLFYSISKGRRENLELYKFADWDLEEKIIAISISDLRSYFGGLSWPSVLV